MRSMASANNWRVSLEGALWLGALVLSLLVSWRILGGDPAMVPIDWGAADAPWGQKLTDLALCLGLTATIAAAGCIRYRRHALERKAAAGLAKHAPEFPGESGTRGTPSIDNELLAAMSHDLRTPMTGILGALELLRYSDLNAHQRMLSLSAETASRSLQRMLDDVLTLARLDVGVAAPELAPFDLRSIVADEIAAWGEEGTQVSATVAERVDTPLIGVGEGVKHAQNALLRLAALHGSGSLRLEIEVLREDAQWQDIEWRLEFTRSGLDASLRDADAHRAPKHQSELVRRLIGQWCERAGLSWWEGDHGRESRSGMRGRFERASRCALGTHAHADSTASHVVLVAEDNEMTRILLGRQLELLGCECDLVNDGVEAFEALSRKHYAMLLTDCQMPRMDGLELTRCIRAMETVARLPILALTADPSPEQRERCLRAGVDDVLPKSTRVHRLAEKLGAWLDLKVAAPSAARPIAGDAGRADADQVRARMSEVFGGDSSSLEGYLASMREEQARLRDSIEAGDIARLRQISHALSGMSAFFGATSLSGIASMVEQSESAAEVFRSAQKLHACIDEFVEWVRAIVRTESSFPTSTKRISEGSHGTM